jgi:hypothetical protein
MDSFASGGIGASIIIALGVIYKIYIAINHKRSRCNLCGRKIEVSLDIDETTPKSRTDAETNQNCKEPQAGKEVESDISNGKRKDEEH